MEKKNYIENIERNPSTKRYILGDPSKLDEKRKLNNSIVDMYNTKIDFIKYIPKNSRDQKYSTESYKYNRAIVVLPGPNQDKKIEKGLSEYKNDEHSILITPEFGNQFDEKELEKGKSLDSILIGNESRNTEENVIDAIYNIKRKFPGVEKITIVSDYIDKLKSEILFKKYAGINYDIDFLGIKTGNKLDRIAYELIRLPFSFLPYKISKKVAEKMRDTDYKISSKNS